MNQGIYYLYEYETGQRKRNLGFLQISHQYRSCMMTLHLKSHSLPERHWNSMDFITKTGISSMLPVQS